MLQTRLNDKQYRKNLETEPEPRTVSMSDYFPPGTCYFYGYPAGEDSGFLNKVPPSVEELVAARIFSCAGPNISVVSFAATNSPIVDLRLLNELDIPYAESANNVLLPEQITPDLTGNKRNTAIEKSLNKMVESGSLVMAQPFLDKTTSNLYQIPPKLTMWLNDKSNLPQLIKPEFLAERLATYKSGKDLIKNSKEMITPCVVKAASSSSGDGVYICKSPDDLEDTRKQLKQYKGTIIIERFIQIKNNYCINFGISYNPSKPIDIIGYNEQLIAENGDFLGGIINSTELPKELDEILDYLLTVALPAIRAMGWYGVGGIDVVTDHDGKAYFIDGNFRMNGTSAYHFLVKKHNLQVPLVTFGGRFDGTQEEFEKAILPYAGKNAKHKLIKLIALSRHENSWNMNGALMFQNSAQLKYSAEMLLEAGIKSSALEQLANKTRV